jgi:tRNA A-37 threonylcarbamoyl transferase component Bud32
VPPAPIHLPTTTTTETTTNTTSSSKTTDPKKTQEKNNHKNIDTKTTGTKISSATTTSKPTTTTTNIQTIKSREETSSAAAPTTDSSATSPLHHPPSEQVVAHGNRNKKPSVSKTTPPPPPPTALPPPPPKIEPSLDTTIQSERSRASNSEENTLGEESLKADEILGGGDGGLDHSIRSHSSSNLGDYGELTLTEDFDQAAISAITGFTGADMAKNTAATTTTIVAFEYPEESPQPDSTSGKRFDELYRLKGVLGTGAFSTVREGFHRSSDIISYAVKCINRKKLSEEDEAALLDEVSILKEMRHQHIIRLFDFFTEPATYYLVMERMRGGELFDRIVAKAYYNEKEARDTCKILLEAVGYCHANHVAHRDLKPENLLLLSDIDDSQVKIADFGFAKKVYKKNSLTTQCGTPGYVAPEILEGTVSSFETRRACCFVLFLIACL